MSRLRSVPTTDQRLESLRVTFEDDPELLRERAPCGYLTTTVNGLICTLNDTFLAWTGYRRHELVGQFRLVDLLTAGGKIYHETHFAPALLMHGAMHEIALEIVRRDGSRLPVLLNAVLERDVSTQSAIVRIAVFDATDRRSYERELMAAKVRAEAAEARARALARTLQATLIPPTPPLIDGLEVASAYRPAASGEQVGGDFYDVFQLAEDDWVVALGDVCGKGVEAAVVTALVRHTLRAVTVRLDSPAQALSALNEVLLRDRADRFCTVALVRLRRSGDCWRATVSTGGHPLPVHRGAAGEVREVGEPGSLTGALAEVAFTDVELVLGPGELLVLYTDGVVEARSALGMYGDDRLMQAIGRCGPTPEAAVDAVLADVLGFADGDVQDDIALVAVGVPSATGRRACGTP